MRPPILTSKRIGEVGMIEDVEELGTELRAEALSKLPILGYREIPVVKAGVTENISAHRAEGSKGRRNHERTAIGEAAVLFTGMESVLLSAPQTSR